MIRMCNRKIKVAIYLDGRPGHEKQTLGVVQELEKLLDVETLKIKVEHQTTFEFIKRLFFFVTGCFLNKKTSTVANCDLYIGTGRQTHLPLLESRRGSNGKAVCCMTPSIFIRSYFDLCIVPYHDAKKEDDKTISTIGSPNPFKNKKQHIPKRNLILLGGVSPKQRWCTESIVKNISQLMQSIHVDNKWVISTSPRTPDDTVERIRKLVLEQNNVEFVRYQDVSSGWVESKYHESQNVWVTADSISMVFEALSAGCNVGLLPVDWKEKNSKFQINERYLLDNEYVVSLSQWLKIKYWPPKRKEFDESARIAHILMERWWKKN